MTAALQVSTPSNTANTVPREDTAPRVASVTWHSPWFRDLSHREKEDLKKKRIKLFESVTYYSFIGGRGVNSFLLPFLLPQLLNTLGRVNHSQSELIILEATFSFSTIKRQQLVNHTTI